MNKYYINPQAEIDLHGYTKKEAEFALLEFLEDCKKKNFLKVRIITGKGLHSKNFEGVLGNYVKDILDNLNYKYSNAKINDGGSGAIIVNL